jgi:hypothetical protein
MPDQTAQNVESLRAAVAWARQLANDQNQTLIAACLGDALDLAEQAVEQIEA